MASASYVGISTYDATFPPFSFVRMGAACRQQGAGGGKKKRDVFLSLDEQPCGPTAPQWPRREDMKKSFNSGGGPSPQGANGVAAAKAARGAVVRGCRRRPERGLHLHQEDAARSPPSPRVEGGGGAALCTISTLPSNIYSCTDGPAVPPLEGGRPEATPQSRRDSRWMGGWPEAPQGGPPAQ